MDILFDEKIYLFEQSGHLAVIPTEYLEELSFRQSRRTLVTSAYYLKEFLEWCDKQGIPWDRAGERDVMDYSQSFPDTLGSHNRKVDRVCDFYRFASKHGIRNPTERFIVAGSHSFRSKRNLLHRKRRCSVEVEVPCMTEIRRFLKSFIHPRDSLIAEIIYHSGMRISEVLHLKRDAVLRASLCNRVVNCEVVGKGNKRRKVIIGEMLWHRIVVYAKAAKGEYLFSVDGSRPLSSDAVEVAFRKASQRSGVKIHPHLLRHAYATQWLEAVTQLTKRPVSMDANLKVLQTLLGHSSLHTTAIYLHVMNRAAAAKLRTDIQLILEGKRESLP